MQALYSDRESRPVSWQRWRQPGRQPGWHDRRVTVITFWSGITADCGPAGPLIFCTCAVLGAHERAWQRHDFEPSSRD